jgi:hypothetical protein
VPSALESAAGILPAPAALTRTPLEQYLHDISPPSHHTLEQAQQGQAKRDFRQAFKAGGREGAAAAASAGNLSARSMRAQAQMATRGWIPSAFARLSWEQAEEGYRMASPEERVQVRGALGHILARTLSGVRSSDLRRTMLNDYQTLMRLPYASPKAAGF